MIISVLLPESEQICLVNLHPETPLSFDITVSSLDNVRLTGEV